jgi:membrane protein implicated in regulation of membrane protease activity
MPAERSCQIGCAVDDGIVQDQEQRDAKSVTIVAGFLLGAAVLVPGLLLLWLADELVGVHQDVGSSSTLVIEATAVVVLVAYVARNRRR